MAVTDFPREVWDFIENNIDTVPQLEALLLIYGVEERIWTAEELATRIYVSVDMARDILETLWRRALILTVEQQPGFRRGLAGDEKAAIVAAVAAAYRSHLVPIATFIHSKASAPVREFARAFELKKDR